MSTSTIAQAPKSQVPSNKDKVIPSHYFSMGCGGGGC